MSILHSFCIVLVKIFLMEYIPPHKLYIPLKIKFEIKNNLKITNNNIHFIYK